MYKALKSRKSCQTIPEYRKLCPTQVRMKMSHLAKVYVSELVTSRQRVSVVRWFIQPQRNAKYFYSIPS